MNKYSFQLNKTLINHSLLPQVLRQGERAMQAFLSEVTAYNAIQDIESNWILITIQPLIPVSAQPLIPVSAQPLILVSDPLDTSIRPPWY